MPHDAVVAAMQRGEAHLSAGRNEAALGCFLAACHTAPAFLAAHRRAAEIHKALGRQAEALQILLTANAVDPTDPEVAAALADSLVFHHRRDDARCAYEAVGAAGRLRPSDLRHYLTLLTELGLYDRVVQVVSAAQDKLDGETLDHALVLSGHARLALGLNRQDLIATAEARERGPRWRTAPQVMAMLRDAVDNARPLSLVRFGDGEARFLVWFDPRLRARLSGPEIERLADPAFVNWFGKPLHAFDAIELVRLHAACLASFEQADILGVSTATRLRQDNLHIGYLAYAEDMIANLLRTEPLTVLANAFVNMELHLLSPHLTGILSGLDVLSVISPHPGIAQRLAHALGVSRVVEYLVPGEGRLGTQWASQGLPPHFPTVYHEMRARLNVPRRGAVFLVAAGLPGKVYCQIVRQRGGIAIDIGSIVDGWAGINSRPGAFDRLEQWTLPG